MHSKHSKVVFNLIKTFDLFLSSEDISMQISGSLGLQNGHPI